MLLKDKVCVVTGAASGIGREISLAYAKEGAKVAGVDVQLQKALDTAGLTGGSAHACDLRSVQQIEQVMQEIYQKYGRVDVLVNGAGLANRTQVEAITEQEWDLLMDVNLKATFFMAQQAYRIMCKQGSGKIINIASHRARMADGRHTIYDATKAGVEAITRSLAVAGGDQGVFTNTLAPTYVITPMTAHNLERKDWVEYVSSRIPIGRLLKAEEMANFAVFMASELSNGMNGHTIMVDGGWTIHE